MLETALWAGAEAEEYSTQRLASSSAFLVANDAFSDRLFGRQSEYPFMAHVRDHATSCVTFELAHCFYTVGLLNLCFFQFNKQTCLYSPPY